MEVAKVRKGYIDTAAGQVHYRCRAGRGTPVVFFHQTASSSVMFDRMMANWPGDHALFALDTPGFGGSYDPLGLPTMREYADALLQALHELGLTRMHLFGHHTGASLAIEIAVAYPERVVSLSMIGPVTITREEAEAFKAVYPKDFIPRTDGSHLKAMWDYVDSIGGASSLTLHQREFTDTSRAWEGHVRVYKMIWDQDFSALFLQVTQPMLLMCSPDDVLWPIFSRACDLRPDAKVAQLAGSNFQPDEVPEAVNAAMLRFLAQVETLS